MNELINEQKSFFDVINKIIRFNKLSHSYLIEINNYDNDIKYIKTFIKMILCNEFDLSNLDDSKTKICSLIDSLNYPDLKFIEPQGQWIKKNQLLELMEEYQNKSLLGNKRIYVIKEADKLNSSSANTILKFLEEPEENIIAILLTNNRYKVLETITSRCQNLSLCDCNNHIEVSDNLISLVEFIIDSRKLFINYKYIIENILIDKDIAKSMFDEVEKLFIDYLNYKVLPNYKCDDKISSILKNVDDEKIIRIITVIEEKISDLVYNVNYKIWIDSIFSRFVEVEKCMM